MNVAPLDLPCGGPFGGHEMAKGLPELCQVFFGTILAICKIYTNSFNGGLVFSGIMSSNLELCQVIENSLISGVLRPPELCQVFFIYSSVDKNYVKFFLTRG